eukprot:CAMPEP_0168778308 /NCGR_PEP_ID=MMETSP0725-20121227/7019_1 /TAXON_ID=265536 /ORGANISM="Amphiprora sp., Strain CCMP467" /LENGTH=77 /DNA_ID=CAMNT_0008828081 /DNA_START=332 /DNA_END=562 /DNA_ORIENTATION=+
MGASPRLRGIIVKLDRSLVEGGGGGGGGGGGVTDFSIGSALRRTRSCLFKRWMILSSSSDMPSSESKSVEAVLLSVW